MLHLLGQGRHGLLEVVQPQILGGAHEEGTQLSGELGVLLQELSQPTGSIPAEETVRLVGCYGEPLTQHMQPVGLWVIYPAQYAGPHRLVSLLSQGLATVHGQLQGLSIAKLLYPTVKGRRDMGGELGNHPPDKVANPLSRGTGRRSRGRGSLLQPRCDVLSHLLQAHHQPWIGLRSQFGNGEFIALGYMAYGFRRGLRRPCPNLLGQLLDQLLDRQDVRGVLGGDCQAAKHLW